MTLTTMQTLIIIAAMLLGTALTRFAPFIFFPKADSAPKYVLYLGKLLPAAAISLLVVYCLRHIDFRIPFGGVAELIAIAVVAVLHLWKKSTLLSIAAGTAAYMLLIQFLFD